MALLLALHPEGFTAAELAVALSAHEHSAVTIRAELTRLRAAWGPIGLSSRPYAVQTPIALDLRDVRTELDRGNIRRAVAALPRTGAARSPRPRPSRSCGTTCTRPCAPG